MNASEQDSAPEGIALLGEEMLTWSDLDGGQDGVGGVPPADGSLAKMLLDLGEQRPARALVAGPHTAELVRGVAEQAEHTDVLVRSYPDAEALRAAIPDSVGVHCGSLGRFVADATPYDVVVALDGPDRLHSAEEARPSRDQVLDQLGSLLSPGGSLLLAVHNGVGLDLLLGVDVSGRGSNADWPEGRVRSSHDEAGVRAQVAALEATLADRSLGVTQQWACFGARHHPTLAVPTGLASAQGADSRLGRMVVAATSSAIADDPGAPATDPRAAVSAVVAAGLGAELAPQWVVQVGGSGVGPGGDVVLVSESPTDRPAVAHRVRVADGTWDREVTADPPAVAWTDAVRCDPARLAGPVPEGPSLEDLLVDQCADQDMVAVGDLVRGYRDWLEAQATTDDAGAQVPGAAVTLTLTDLVRSPERAVEVADGRLVADGAAPADEVLARTLLVVGQRILARAARHPWSATATPATIARSLAAAAGVEIDSSLMDRAVALDGRLRSDPVDVHATAPPAASYADLLAQVADQRTRLTEAEAQLEWLVSNIHVRQRALRASRGRVADLETSAEFRIGKRVLPFRTLVKKGRDWARERREGPMHEWRAKPKVRDPIPVDPDLLPKGYTPKGDEV